MVGSDQVQECTDSDDEKRKTLVNNASSSTLLTGVAGKHCAGRVDSFFFSHALSELQQLVRLVLIVPVPFGGGDPA